VEANAVIRQRGRASAEELLFRSERPKLRIRRRYNEANDVTLFHGDCMELTRQMPNRCADLIVTSPPYNIGKEYETRLDLGEYVAQQSRVIRECFRLLSTRGSICW
jgi:DNA modification methylase